MPQERTGLVFTRCIGNTGDERSSMRQLALSPVCPDGVQPRPHRWVAAALVDVGLGVRDKRAERAARTGRYVVPAAMLLEVLEVYCELREVNDVPRHLCTVPRDIAYVGMTGFEPATP